MYLVPASRIWGGEYRLNGRKALVYACGIVHMGFDVDHDSPSSLSSILGFFPFCTEKDFVAWRHHFCTEMMYRLSARWFGKEDISKRAENGNHVNVSSRSPLLPHAAFVSRLPGLEVISAYASLPFVEGDSGLDNGSEVFDSMQHFWDWKCASLIPSRRFFGVS
ncbi:hypothetical protein EDD85DRAFT_798875 [Armillaria nabsnona]|nr:hypothetical protein EDD85DRAFT_798875 [Armillaria nabsnona]